MGIIHGPIQRIDIPDMLVISLDDAAFLGKDVMVGIFSLDLTEEEGFGLVIHFGDEVDHALIVHLMFLAVTSAKDRARLTRKAFEF
jgi:hypothetical protein